MVSSEIIETQLFRIQFSRTKTGEPDKKFPAKEQAEIINAVKRAEETISRIMSFSKIKPARVIYTVPVIFEKVTKKIFEEKHKNHHAMIDFPPVGSIWNPPEGRTTNAKLKRKYQGIEIKSRTAVISLCTKLSISETIAHEVVHAFFDSFYHENGNNAPNFAYFIEGITEWLAKLTFHTDSK